jgi:ATP-dependent RNA helicase DOB1
MSFVHICNLQEKPTHTVTELAIKYKFPLDIFQEHAISASDQGHNVLCSCKTGSGKTLVGEYQIAHSLRQGKRVFYTTPIKSLSNQKFHDLKAMWSEPGQVGIMTGDIKFCPNAQIIVMTTEILRNLLYKQGTSTEHVGLTASLSLEDLGAVVFDECHYINDKDRGAVWEETMILLPPSVQLIMLSATLNRPELFAEWIGELKQIPCHVIQTQFRVVPLTHSIIQGGELKTIMDNKEIF